MSNEEKLEPEDFEGIDTFVDDLRHGQENEIKNLRDWLQLIADVAEDRDGETTAPSLAFLVDELRVYALSALAGKKYGMEKQKDTPV